MYDCVLSILHLKNKLNWTEPMWSRYLNVTDRQTEDLP